MAIMNKQIILDARPSGFPKESDFKLVESPVPAPAASEILVRSLYLSVDPYMRPMMIAGAKSYRSPLEIGQVMVGGAVSEVIESHDPQFARGDIVVGMFGWQQYA